jgi:8-oxo-dGTP pyrophosphatase MutT (NUDIX family)
VDQKKIATPVDAAGLVLLRDRAASIEVLLGRRHTKSSFLPDYYVYPGGRVDPGDSFGGRLALAPGVEAHLARASRRPAHAIVKAAIRETAEETGLRFPAELATRHALLGSTADAGRGIRIGAKKPATAANAAANP